MTRSDRLARIQVLTELYDEAWKNLHTDRARWLQSKLLSERNLLTQERKG